MAKHFILKNPGAVFVHTMHLNMYIKNTYVASLLTPCNYVLNCGIGLVIVCDNF